LISVSREENELDQSQDHQNALVLKVGVQFLQEENGFFCCWRKKFVRGKVQMKACQKESPAFDLFLTAQFFLPFPFLFISRF